MAEDSKIANLDDANSTKNALLKAAGKKQQQGKP